MTVPKVWVYAEGEEGKATSATLELLTKARELGDTVEAVYSGADADTLAPQLGEYGATKVHAADHGSSLSGVIGGADRKSTRLNSSHLGISYAVFWLKKQKKDN